MPSVSWWSVCCGSRGGWLLAGWIAVNNTGIVHPPALAPHVCPQDHPHKNYPVETHHYLWLPLLGVNYLLCWAALSEGDRLNAWSGQCSCHGEWLDLDKEKPPWNPLKVTIARPSSSPCQARTVAPFPCARELFKIMSTFFVLWVPWLFPPCDCWEGADKFLALGESAQSWGNDCLYKCWQWRSPHC